MYKSFYSIIFFSFMLMSAMDKKLVDFQQSKKIVRNQCLLPLSTAISLLDGIFTRTLKFEEDKVVFYDYRSEYSMPEQHSSFSCPLSVASIFIRKMIEKHGSTFPVYQKIVSNNVCLLPSARINLSEEELFQIQCLRFRTFESFIYIEPSQFGEILQLKEDCPHWRTLKESLGRRYCSDVSFLEYLSDVGIIHQAILYGFSKEDSTLVNDTQKSGVGHVQSLNDYLASWNK